MHPDTCKRLINGYKSAFFGVQIFAPRLLRLFTVRSTRENFGGNVEECGAAAMLENVGDFRSNPSKTLSRPRECPTTGASSQRVNTCRTSRRGSPASPREPCPLSSQLEQLRALRRTTPERSAPRDTSPELPTNRRGGTPTRKPRGTTSRHSSYFSRNSCTGTGTNTSRRLFHVVLSQFLPFR